MADWVVSTFHSQTCYTSYSHLPHQLISSSSSSSSSTTSSFTSKVRTCKWKSEKMERFLSWVAWSWIAIVTESVQRSMEKVINYGRQWMNMIRNCSGGLFWPGVAIWRRVVETRRWWRHRRLLHVASVVASTLCRRRLDGNCRTLSSASVPRRPSVCWLGRTWDSEVIYLHQYFTTSKSTVTNEGALFIIRATNAINACWRNCWWI